MPPKPKKKGVQTKWEEDFITQALQAMEDARSAERVSRKEWAARCGTNYYNFRHIFPLGKNLQLATVARMLHKLGKKPLLLVVDEVNE